MVIAGIALATLLVPLAVGLLLGVALRRVAGGRVAGMGTALAGLALPALLTGVTVVAWPVVGLWDALLAGFLCGVGLLWTAHRAYAEPRRIALTVGSVALTCLLLEGLTRLVLGPPPHFHAQDGPHLRLHRALRTTPPDTAAFRMPGMPAQLARRALQGDLAQPAEQLAPAARPPGAMVTSELVCAIVYGDAYRGVLDVSREPRVQFPARFTPRPGAARRVLHVGDSLVFGANVPREAAFAAELERLEPAVEHINGGISGMAPDGYLLVLQQWLARHRVDLAVLYLFEGNDLSGIGAPHPCANWDSIVAYDGETARLRYADGPRGDAGIGLAWLLVNSPMPYVGRALVVAHSAAAAWAGSGLAGLARLGSFSAAPRLQFERLAALLRTARDDTRARGIPLVVVVFPAAQQSGSTPRGVDFAAEVQAIATRLGIPFLDATPPIRAAMARGDNPVQSDGAHLNELGHRVVAQWLHERLPAAAAAATP